MTSSQVRTGPTAQQALANFDPAALADRHDRQLSLLQATGALGTGPYTILDLGGGSGVTAVWAARKGWPVTVVDIDADNLAVLRKLLAGPEAGLPITTHVGDVCGRLDLPEGAFDIVYLKDLVEHVPDYDTALAQAFRALKSGGLVYVATTNVLCPLQQEYHGVGPYSWYPRWLKDRIRVMAMTTRPEIVHHTPYPAVHWFSRGTLSTALRRAGFTGVFDIYDLVRRPADLTRRTRLVYPFIRLAGRLTLLRPLVDVLVPGLTLVAMKPRA